MKNILPPFLLLWLCYSVRTEHNCNSNGICTYTYNLPEPFNRGTIDLSKERDTISNVNEIIVSLKRNLTEAYKSFIMSNSKTTNLTTIQNTITTLNNIIDDLTKEFNNNLLSSINSLQHQLAEIDDEVNCYTSCSTTTTKVTTEGAPTTSTIYDVCLSEEPCKFESTCTDTNDSERYSCTCVSSTSATFSGQNCTDYEQSLIRSNDTSGQIYNPTSGDPNTPYTFVVADWELESTDLSNQFQIDVTYSIGTDGDYLSFTDSNIPFPSTLKNYTEIGEDTASFLASVGGTVGISFHGSETSSFTLTYSTSRFDPCNPAPDCGAGTCVTSLSDPTQYSCICPTCFTGEKCQIDNSNKDTNCTQLGGDNFCNNQGGGCCYWGPCSTDIPKCSQSYCSLSTLSIINS